MYRGKKRVKRIEEKEAEKRAGEQTKCDSGK